MTYPVELYNETRETVKSSATVAVPILMELFRPQTVVDVGCGEGWWVATFHEHGVKAGGIDQHAGVTLRAELNLEEPIPLDDFADHDLALCLEVAEHLTPPRAPSFVKELCALAPTVIFSAAIPGQGGAGHLNEQWPAYWVELFHRQGYGGSGAMRSLIWSDKRIAPWYRQNLLVFGEVGALELDGCPSLVHPEIWNWYRG